MLVKPIEINKPDGTIAENETLSLSMRGTISGGAGLGFYVCGLTDAGRRNPMAGVYSERRSGYNQYTSNSKKPRYRVWYKRTTAHPTNPQTAEQQIRRTAFSNAVAEWHLLDDYQKKLLDKEGNARGITGLNFFVSKVMAHLN